MNETKEGIQIDDALFGTPGYGTLIIDCREGLLTLVTFDRTESILEGTGFFQFPVGASLLKVISTAVCNVSIDWYERNFL